MVSFPLLTALIVIPLLGAFIAFLINGEEKNISKFKRISNMDCFSRIIFKSIILVFQFNFNSAEFQFVEK